MLYAEKIMISRKDQMSPMHRHIVKAEDIINRGGGTLVLELFMPNPDGSIDRDAEVSVPTDGVVRTLKRRRAAASSIPARASRCCRASGTPSGARAATC